MSSTNGHTENTIGKSFRKSLVLSFILCFFCTVAQAVSYTVIDLNPTGFINTRGLGSGGSQQVGYGTIGGKTHAVLWNGSSSGYVDLHPASGYTNSYGYATSGLKQAGAAFYSATNKSHAMLWNGSASGFVDLHPASGYISSIAYGINGAQQVGSGNVDTTNTHALLWSGTSAGIVDLNPTGFSTSAARATDGSKQVGYGSGTATSNQFHALLWSGTKSSYVDLHPLTGYSVSYALGICGLQQVGYGTSSTGDHALLWSGSAASYIDLNPDGFKASGVYATNGKQQVGEGTVTATGIHHALLWNSSAGNFIDLHSFLSRNYTSSYAESIDSLGNVVGYAYDSNAGTYHAMLWQVPEPTTICLLGLGVSIFARRKK